MSMISSAGMTVPYAAMYHDIGTFTLSIIAPVPGSDDEIKICYQMSFRANRIPSPLIYSERGHNMRDKAIMFSAYTPENPAPTCFIPAGVDYGDLRNVFEIYFEEGSTEPKFRCRYNAP